MGNEMPKRLAEARSASEKLSLDLAEAFTVLPGNTHMMTAESRPICDSVVVNVWTDVHGRQSLEVVSNREMSVLEAKGFLHDALYTLAHAEDSVRPASA